MATVNKDFKIKSGLIVEGTNGTINGENILTTSQASTDHIVNIVGGTTLVTSVSGNLNVTSGDLAINESGLATDLAGTRLYADGSSINVDVEGIYDDLVANGVATTTDISTAISNAASNYDAAGSATTAENNAKGYADSLASNYDAAGAASTAETNAKNYADGLAVNYDAAGAASQALTSANTYTDNAVADLVGTAPATLDTLQELATALQDNPDIITNLESVASGKQNSFTAGTGLEFNVMGDILKVSDNTYDAYGAATTAQSNANSYTDTAISNLNLSANYDAYGAAAQAEQNAKNYADNLTTDDVAEGVNNLYLTEARVNDFLTTSTQTNISITEDTNGHLVFVAENGVSDSTTDDLTEGTGNLYFTNSRAVDAITNATISPTIVNINNYRKEEATQQYVTNASTVNVHQFDYPYESVKYLVRVVGFVGGVKHSQLTEILATIDGNNNIALTEYGTVCTNTTDLASFSAALVAGKPTLTATTSINGCEVIAAATLLSWAD